MYLRSFYLLLKRSSSLYKLAWQLGHDARDSLIQLVVTLVAGRA
jgi:hypothetical protein